jgi:hypothetical protein
MGKINKGRVAVNERHPSTTQQHRTSGKEPRRTPNKNKRGHKEKHGRDITLIINNRK